MKIRNNLHDYSIDIEFYSKTYIDCGRGGTYQTNGKTHIYPFGSFIDANSIDKNPFITMFIVLSMICINEKLDETSKAAIFFEKYEKYLTITGQELFNNNRNILDESVNDFINIVKKDGVR